MNPIDKVLKIALQEVDYCEKSIAAVAKDPCVLDEKTAGAGTDNLTKYARDLLRLVGSPYAQGVAWCDEWFDWIMIQAFGVETAKKMIGGWSAYTPTSAQYYKDMGRWYTSPKVGDQIFFKNSMRICHTGIVYMIDSKNVYTIEGNTSNKDGVVSNGGCVAKKSYALNNSRIAGYGRPKYELAAETPKKYYLYKGVDVSAAQTNVDYSKLKTAGVDFAIIKIIRKDMTPDTMFEKHYSGFTNAGISCFAVYNYSYATTVEKARNDAKVVISTLAGRRVAVCLDVEDNVQKGLGKLLIDIINAYQEIIESAGLPFLIYTGLSFFNSNIKPYLTELRCKDIWMARYYKGDAPMPFNEDPDKTKNPMENLVGWQYTSHGKVSGYNNNIDLSIIYRDIATPLPTTKTSIVTKVRTSGSRLNVRNAAPNGAIVDRLLNGAIVDVLGVKDGWYKIGDERFVSGEYIKSNTIGIITANKLNIRSADSKNGNIVGTYSKGDTVEILRQSSTRWYLTPKGWISNNYVRLS